jgi:hypothetical protein
VNKADKDIIERSFADPEVLETFGTRLKCFVQEG